MATPNDRRVVYGTHVVPQEAIVREEGATTYKLDATVAKRFGGKGSVDINSDQAVDGWTSFLSPVDNLWEAVDNVWNLDQTVWDGKRAVGPASDAAFPATLRSDTVNIDFLYVKNLGSVECQLALEGNEFDILIPGGAAVSMRTTSSVTANNVKVATEASSSTTTTIEYVIAI